MISVFISESVSPSLSPLLSLRPLVFVGRRRACTNVYQAYKRPSKTRKVSRVRHEPLVAQVKIYVDDQNDRGKLSYAKEQLTASSFVLTKAQLFKDANRPEKFGKGHMSEQRILYFQAMLSQPRSSVSGEPMAQRPTRTRTVKSPSKQFRGTKMKVKSSSPRPGGKNFIEKIRLYISCALFCALSGFQPSCEHVGTLKAPDRLRITQQRIQPQQNPPHESRSTASAYCRYHSRPAQGKN